MLETSTSKENSLFIKLNFLYFFPDSSNKISLDPTLEEYSPWVTNFNVTSLKVKAKSFGTLTQKFREITCLTYSTYLYHFVD